MVFDIDRDKHIAIASKDRTSIFDGFCERLEISHGEAIRNWLDTGIEAPAPVTEQPQQTPDPTSTPATEQEEGKGNPLEADPNPPVISLEQVQQLLTLIAETQTNEVRFLQYLQVETLAHLPVNRFTWAVKSLEAKKKAASENNSSLVIAALSARNIPYKVDEQAGEIHATPSFQDSGAKAFLKEQGFKWNPAGKAWIKQAA